MKVLLVVIFQHGMGDFRGYFMVIVGKSMVYGILMVIIGKWMVTFMDM